MTNETPVGARNLITGDLNAKHNAIHETTSPNLAGQYLLKLILREPIKNLITNKPLTNRVKHATRTGKTSSNMLDIVLSNDDWDLNVKHIKGISDHDILLIKETRPDTGIKFNRTETTSFKWEEIKASHLEGLRNELVSIKEKVEKILFPKNYFRFIEKFSNSNRRIQINRINEATKYMEKAKFKAYTDHLPNNCSIQENSQNSSGLFPSKLRKALKLKNDHYHALRKKGLRPNEDVKFIMLNKKSKDLIQKHKNNIENELKGALTSKPILPPTKMFLPLKWQNTISFMNLT